MPETGQRTASRPARLKEALLVLMLGAVTGLGHPPFDLALVTLFGLSAGFWVLQNSRDARYAFRAGLAFGTGYFAVSIHWIVEPFFVDPVRHGWMAPFAISLMAVGLALFWAAAFWAARRLSVTAWPIVLTLTLAELGRAYLFGGFPWGMPSYVLVDGLAGQAAALVGPHGLNLVLFGLAWALSQLPRAQGRKRHMTLIAGLAGLAAIYFPPPESPPRSQDAPVVRLIQPNAPQDLKWDPDHMRRFFERAVLFTGLGEDRPDLIVWPETSVPVLLHRATNTLDVIAEAADGVPVVFGVNRVEGALAYNSAALLDRSGTVTQVYDKHHLVPFGEYIPFGNLLARFGVQGFASQHGDGYSAGPGPALLDLGPLGKALPLICYEAVFPQDMRGVAERPALLLQLTNDAWFGNFSGPYQHLAQARMRAIEQGLPMVRAANTGVSAVVDAHGSVMGSIPLNEEGFIDIALPQALNQTLYARTGDLPLFVLLLFLTGTLAYRSRIKSD